jgi:hypothetical protein
VEERKEGKNKVKASPISVDEIHAVERHTHHILVVFWVIFVHACGG